MESWWSWESVPPGRATLLTLLAALIVLVISGCGVSEWIPYIPSSEEVSIEVSDGTETEVLVKVVLRNACYRLEKWNSLHREDQQFWIDLEIEKSTADACAQVYLKMTRGYDMGALASGEYEFTVKAWGEEVKTVKFIV